VLVASDGKVALAIHDHHQDSGVTVGFHDSLLIRAGGRLIL
jgi:hypothetical protein